MTDPSSAATEMKALRFAASTRDWNACRDATRSLLRRLPPHRALELVREQVERRVPIFERHQPAVTWPREFIRVATGTSYPGEAARRWPDESDFPGPGANDFTLAVEDLWLASRALNDTEKPMSICRLIRRDTRSGWA